MILSKNREDELRKFATNIRLNTLRTLIILWIRTLRRKSVYRRSFSSALW
ncbi:transketolase n-terminal section [Streptococcus pneumoniae]|nr:transketolase n-terminal section [Streptococcus pneumoniae]